MASAAGSYNDFLFGAGLHGDSLISSTPTLVATVAAATQGGGGDHFTSSSHSHGHHPSSSFVGDIFGAGEVAEVHPVVNGSAAAAAVEASTADAAAPGDASSIEAQLADYTDAAVPEEVADDTNHAGQIDDHGGITVEATNALDAANEAARVASSVANHVEARRMGVAIVGGGFTGHEDPRALAAAHRGTEVAVPHHDDHGLMHGLKMARTALLVTGGMCNKLFGLGMMGFLVFQSMKSNAAMTATQDEKKPEDRKKKPELVSSPKLHQA